MNGIFLMLFYLQGWIWKDSRQQSYLLPGTAPRTVLVHGGWTRMCRTPRGHTAPKASLMIRRVSGRTYRPGMATSFVDHHRTVRSAEGIAPFGHTGSQGGSEQSNCAPRGVCWILKGSKISGERMD